MNGFYANNSNNAMCTGHEGRDLFHDHNRVSQIQNILENKINKRPDRKYLIQNHILNDTHVAPSLQVYEQSLKRARLADNLNDKLLKRPGPLELVEHNILQTDPIVKEVLRDGLIPYEKTTAVLHQERLHAACMYFDYYPVISESSNNEQHHELSLNKASDHQQSSSSQQQSSNYSVNQHHHQRKYNQHLQSDTVIIPDREQGYNSSQIAWINTHDLYNQHNNNNDKNHCRNYFDLYKLSTEENYDNQELHVNKERDQFDEVRHSLTHSVVNRSDTTKKRKAREINVECHPVKANSANVVSKSNNLIPVNALFPVTPPPTTTASTTIPFSKTTNISRHKPLVFHEYNGPTIASDVVRDSLRPTSNKINYEINNQSSTNHKQKNDINSNRSMFDFYKILLHQQKIFLHLVQHFQLSADMAANCVRKHESLHRDCQAAAGKDNYYLNSSNDTEEINQCEVWLALKQLRVTDLRAHCRKQGLVVGGTKDELIRRISDHARDNQSSTSQCISSHCSPTLPCNKSSNQEENDVNWSDHYLIRNQDLTTTGGNQNGLKEYTSFNLTASNHRTNDVVQDCQNKKRNINPQIRIQPSEVEFSSSIMFTDKTCDSLSANPVERLEYSSLDDTLISNNSSPSMSSSNIIGDCKNDTCNELEDMDVSQLFASIEESSSSLLPTDFYCQDYFIDNTQEISEQSTSSLHKSQQLSSSAIDSMSTAKLAAALASATVDNATTNRADSAVTTNMEDLNGEYLNYFENNRLLRTFSLYSSQ
ncbi:hypothetical protein GJ496_009762 [Pomphorhynchus laevis]|nr:hypothetical protein GJ496_009762 [Pomphorhynchus laevis]